MKYPSDLTGFKFGRLTVIRKNGVERRGKSSHSIWLCLCDCGMEKSVVRDKLISGDTISCGCYKRESAKKRFKKHGMAGTRIWKIWVGMRSRCNRESDKSYPDYGGRGISVCEEWSKFEPFAKWALLNGYANELTIERIDVNGDYCPKNCKWATKSEQSNNKRNNRMINYEGKKQSLADWSRELNIPYRTLLSRINMYGWSVERAFTTKGN